MATRRRIIKVLKIYDRLYQRRAKVGTIYGAVGCFAVIFASLPALDDPLRREWSDRLNNDPKIAELLDAPGLTEIAEGLERDVKRIRHILSIGTKWNDDEIVLVLTIRVQIDCILRFLEKRGIEFGSVSLDDVDTRLQEIKNSPENSSDYRSAAGQMRKNGLPIGDRWTRYP